jgi:tetrahedral aminopeptidase
MQASQQEYKSPQIGPDQIGLLEKLSNAVGVSGDEGEVRSIVLEELRAHFSSNPAAIKVDALGNVLVTVQGDAAIENRPRVMVAAHMDEVGFMIVQDEERGYFRFDLVGGLDMRYLAGKPVWVGRDHIPGVIGARPIHLTTPEERRVSISLETLRIDMGASISGKVKVGDRATFATQFVQIGPSVRGKALDDRIGVAILLELVKQAPPNIDLLAAFTVQEEVGLRGAGVAAYALNPDMAFVVDSTPAHDLPTWEAPSLTAAENISYNTRLGAGPAIYIADSSTISDPRLVQHLVETADQHNIPYQFRQPGGGGTDAGAIHRKRAGIPSVSVSVPGRYHHTPASICRLSDWQNTLALLHAALSRVSPDLLAGERL